MPEATEDLGFPTFATKNTTRVSGPDPTADAAGVSLAVWPSTGDLPGPDAVTLVDAGEWQAGLAAASLVAAPVGAPILLTEAGAVPPLTGDGAASARAGGLRCHRGPSGVRRRCRGKPRGLRDARPPG